MNEGISVYLDATSWFSGTHLLATPTLFQITQTVAGTTLQSIASSPFGPYPVHSTTKTVCHPWGLPRLYCEQLNWRAACNIHGDCGLEKTAVTNARKGLLPRGS